MAEEQQKNPYSPENDPDMIKRFDRAGRPLYMKRADWLSNVLMPSIEASWDDPVRLETYIMGGIEDGFYAEMVRPAERLSEIADISERAAAILGTVYREVGRVGDAARVLEGYLHEHGDKALILAGLARLWAEHGNAERARRTIWRSVQLDPNDARTLAYYIKLERDARGSSGQDEALRHAAALPGSWRATAWLARQALEERDLAGANRMYQQVLEKVGRPVPEELVEQISGDLGSLGYAAEVLEIALPLFDSETHGIQAASNLLTALVAAERLDEAKSMVDLLYSRCVPAWSRDLGLWDHRITKKRLEAAPEEPTEDLPRMMLVHAPLWLPRDSPARTLFPDHAPDETSICFLGSTLQLREGTKWGPEERLSNIPGRLSRALPLFLAERVHMAVRAAVQVLTPVRGPAREFLVIDAPFSASDGAGHARSAGNATYVVLTHLTAVAQPWLITMRLVRIADGECIAHWDGTFPGQTPAADVNRLANNLISFCASDLEIPSQPESMNYMRLGDLAMNHYLSELEQLQAAAFSEDVPEAWLSFHGEHEVLEQALEAAGRFSPDVPFRLVAIQLLKSLGRRMPNLFTEYLPRFQELHRSRPLHEPAGSVIQGMIDRLGK